MSNAPIGSRITKLKRVESTNSFLLDQVATASLLHGDTVVSGFQSGGKGLAQNTWESEEGKNLLLSIYLQPPHFEADKQFYLNMAVSLSVLHSIKKYIHSQAVHIKWPNDIYVDKKKISGILITHSVMGSLIEHSVVGIGLNVNQREFFSGASNPVSLINILQKETDISEVQQVLLDEMNRYYNMLSSGQLDAIKQQYISVLLGYEQWRDYIYQTIRIEGKIKKILAFGQLELETRNGRILKCNFKEIEFVI